MIVRNEADRYLHKALDSAFRAVGAWGGGRVRVVDDCSDDNTANICRQSGADVLVLKEPTFWRHEGEARNRAYRWAYEKLLDENCWDWILVLDGDETLSHPERLKDIAQASHRYGQSAAELPLYEFWTPHSYRTDGLWWGRYAKRLFQYRKGGRIPLVEFGGSNVPSYVDRAHRTDECHLLHWGYALAQDRKRKHAAYIARSNGHGHRDEHIASITSKPTLKRYRWKQ